MDLGPPPYLQHNAAHDSAGGVSRMDNYSDTSAYGCNGGDAFHSAAYSNLGTQYGPYSMCRNWTTDPPVYYGRPNESYGYPGGPFWFPYVHQQYSFPISMAQPPQPYAPPLAYMQQRNYPYCAPLPPSTLAMLSAAPREPPPYASSTPEHRLPIVHVEPREHRLPPPAEHRNMHVSSLNLSSDELDLRRNSDQSGGKWDDDEASFYEDVKILSSRSSVMSDENRKGKKSPSDIGPRGLTVGGHLWAEPNNTVQNRQIFHQKSLNRKQDNNYANVVVTEKRLESKRAQEKTESTAGKSCYACAELPWDKWASARPEGQRPMWSDLHHLSIRELDATISCFIKDYPQLISSVDSQQTSGFIKKSLEELENYLRKECHRYECQFLSDYPNQNFPLMSSALENSLHQMKFAGNNAKTRQQKREIRSNITSFHEADLWAKGILGINNSVILLTTVHFYVSKCFGVRGRQKHQALRLDHFHFGEDPEGRYVRFHYDNKEPDLDVTKNMISIKQYDDPENPRSVYKIIKIYVDAIENKVTLADFYRKPHNHDNSKISFSWSALAGSEISELIPRAMQKAGHEGSFNTLSFHQSVRNILKASGLPSAIQDLRAGVRSPSLLARVHNSGPVSNDTEVLISRLLDPPKPNNHSPLISEIADQQYHDNKDSRAEIPDTCKSRKLVSQATRESSRPMSLCSCGRDHVDNTVKESTTVAKISDGRSAIENLEKVFHTLSTSFTPQKDAISSSDEFDSNDSLETKSPAPVMDISTHAHNVEEKSSNNLADIDPSSFVDITLDSTDDPYLLVISERDTITLTEKYPNVFETVQGDMSETLAASDTDSPPLVNLSGQSDPLLTSTPRTITPSVTPQRPSTDTSPSLLMECYDNSDNGVPVIPTTLAERIQPTNHDNSPALYSVGRSELICPPPKKRKIDHNKENRHDN